MKDLRPEPGLREPEPLATSRELFAALEANDLRYVHWKSNEHLGPALAGETDLDVLFDRLQYQQVHRVLAACGFKPFRTTAAAAYPGIEDHLAVDPETGRLVHCHAHFLLSVGERYLKGYRIPWEERFLATASVDPATGVRVADPALELAMLILRSALKLRGRDRAAAVAGRPALADDVWAEYEWLRARSGPDELSAIGRELLDPEAATALVALHGTRPTHRGLRRLRRLARPRLEEWRTWSRSSGLRERWLREFRAARSALNRGTLGRSTPARRTVPRGGILVAVLGADGAGKSTVVREVSNRLARKVDVMRLYFGSGDGPVSLLRSPLRPAARFARRHRLARSERGRGEDPRAGSPGAGIRVEAPVSTVPGSGPGHRAEPAVIRAGRIAWALSLAREKRARLARAWRARNRGLVVITDRFPQAQIAGFNDGPLLRDRAETGGSLLRRAARREERVYRLAERQAPDLVIRLRVTPEVAVRRKPEMSASEVERRDAAIGSLRWPSDTRVVDVDADRPLADVLRDTMVAIWREI